MSSCFSHRYSTSLNHLCRYDNQDSPNLQIIITNKANNTRHKTTWHNKVLRRSISLRCYCTTSLLFLLYKWLAQLTQPISQCSSKIRLLKEQSTLHTEDYNDDGQSASSTWHSFGVWLVERHQDSRHTILHGRRQSQAPLCSSVSLFVFSPHLIIS